MGSCGSGCCGSNDESLLMDREALSRKYNENIRKEGLSERRPSNTDMIQSENETGSSTDDDDVYTNKVTPQHPKKDSMDFVIVQKPSKPTKDTKNEAQTHQTLMGFATNKENKDIDTKQNETSDEEDSNSDQNEGKPIPQHETLMGFDNNTTKKQKSIDTTHNTNGDGHNEKSESENLKQHETLMGFAKDNNSDHEAETHINPITMIGVSNNDEKIKFVSQHVQDK